MSVAWGEPLFPADSGYSVILSDVGPDQVASAPMLPVCLGCLLEDGDEQLSRGLDLARVHGQVDYDPAADEWFVA